MESKNTSKEISIDDKITYAGWAARFFLFAGAVFIGWGMVAKVMVGDPNANYIAFTGLMWVALCGVFAWIKKKQEYIRDGEPTYHSRD